MKRKKKNNIVEANNSDKKYTEPIILNFTIYISIMWFL